jgi:formylglycine-generating enzyme required for sulfatase activity
MIRVLVVAMSLCLLSVVAVADDGAEMVLVPAGEFTMGGQGKGLDEDREEAPPDQVTLPAFSIDRLEVTTTQYCRFLNATRKTQDAEGHGYFGLPQYLPIRQAAGQWQPEVGREQFPMSDVTWYGATAYAQWAGKRLPTEAEWEKAARGMDGRKFPWGSDFDQSKMRFGQTKIGPVGGFPAGASPCGALDMAGNVWEWTSSLFKPYPYVATDGREEPIGATDRRVARGGSWEGEPYIATTTYRFRPLPDDAYPFLGFRCAQDVP